MSTGVTSWPGTRLTASGASWPSWLDWYGVKTFPSTARESSVLSTPQSTSPSGRPAVRMALLTSVPASPLLATLTAMPVSLVNWASASGSVKAS